MKNFLIGCGVILVLVVGGLVVGGLWIWNQAAPLVTQGFQQVQKLEKELQRVVPNIKDAKFGFESVNGKNKLKLTVPVTFDPSQGKQAEQTAQQILAVVKQNLPTGLPAAILEMQMIRQLPNGAKQERVFMFNLTQK